MRYRSLFPLLVLFAPVLRAQSALVSIVNGDTAMVERFTRTTARLEGEITAKGGLRQVYAYAINERGQLGAMTMSFSLARRRRECAGDAEWRNPNPRRQCCCDTFCRRWRASRDAYQVARDGPADAESIAGSV